MDARLEQEVGLLRDVYADLRHQDRWVLIPQYALPSGWEPSPTDVAFFVREGFPGVSPYGIYVPVGLRFKGQTPNNYSEPAGTQPPFGGTWALFSWEAAQWRPAVDPREGHNLVDWVQGFSRRFQEGV